MRNCLILGSGRSGTSMVAGTLAAAGYYMGETMMPPTDANPKGYFESREVEDINEGLIRSMLTPVWWERRLRLIKPPPQQPNFADGPHWGRSRWLASIPPWRRPQPKPRFIEGIQEMVAHQPYCFKDPRFAYTLYSWRPYLKDTVFICVFRDPAVTATSILKEVERAEYLAGVTLSFEQALLMWTYVYQHILKHHSREGQWLFLHYEQVLTPAGLDQIAALTEADIDRAFPETGLRRTQSDHTVPAETTKVYQQLCALADYRLPETAS